MGEPSRKPRDVQRAVFTLPNCITIARIAFVPLWLVIAYAAVDDTGMTGGNSLFRLFSLGVFLLLCLTDKIDGHLARKRQEITALGQFLDPIADKILVLACMLYLFELKFISVWIILVILTRDFVISALRMLEASRGVVVPASNLGKYKTACTLISLCLFLLAFAFSHSSLYSGILVISNVTLYIALILTLWSAYAYIKQAIQLF